MKGEGGNELWRSEKEQPWDLNMVSKSEQYTLSGVLNKLLLLAVRKSTKLSDAVNGPACKPGGLT